MISIELIRREPDVLRESGRKRGHDIPVDHILELDERRRSAILEGDVLRARRNEVNRRLGQVKERPPELIQEMRDVGARPVRPDRRGVGIALEALLAGQSMRQRTLRG